MTLNMALNAALSSINLIDKQMATASNNISNANTPGYTNETVRIAENVAGTTRSGVIDLGTFGNVNQFLLNAVIRGTGVSSRDAAFSALYQQLQTALGSVTTSDTGGSDLVAQFDNLKSDMTNLETMPTNTGQRTSVVNDLQDIVLTFQSLSSEIQHLRNDAETKIGTSVTDANTQLQMIQQLNSRISIAQSNDGMTAGMIDERNTALQKLNTYLGVDAFIDNNGMMSVYTSASQPLLIGTTLLPLNFTPQYLASNSSIDNGDAGKVMIGQTDITKQISTGTIAGLLDMRDTELPNAQNSLDYFAQQFSGKMNNTYNNGTSVPPPALVNGMLSSSSDYTFSLTDKITVAANTKIMIATMDSIGSTGSTSTMQADNAITVTLDSADTTISDIVNDINTTTNINVIAAISASGQLTLTPKSGGSINNYSIAVTTLSGGITTDTATTSSTTSSPENFGAYFHLNDLITNGSSAKSISLNPGVLNYPASFVTATVTTDGVGSMDSSAVSALFNTLNNRTQFLSGSATGTTVFSGSPTTALNLTGNFTVAGNGNLLSVSVSITDSLSDIVNSINSAGTGISASLVGSGNQYQIQISSGGDGIAFSNNNGPNILGVLGLSSSPSGYISSSYANFSGYATSIIGDVATRAESANTQQTTSSAALTTLQSNLSSQTGVNVDEQMANITSLQNLYAASAKIISVVQAMFSSLITTLQA